MVMKKDLVDVGDKDYDQRQGEFVFCPKCSNEFGGTRGDYFLASPEHIFVCDVCTNKDLQLVRRVCTLEVIKS